MSIVEFLLFLFSCAGTTFIVVHAEIMDRLRLRQLLNKWEFTRSLIKCSLCTGTWIGALYGLVYSEWKFLIPLAFASAAASFLFERFTILLDELVLKLENERNQKDSTENQSH